MLPCLSCPRFFLPNGQTPTLIPPKTPIPLLLSQKTPPGFNIRLMSWLNGFRWGCLDSSPPAKKFGPTQGSRPPMVKLFLPALWAKINWWQFHQIHYVVKDFQFGASQWAENGPFSLRHCLNGSGGEGDPIPSLGWGADPPPALFCMTGSRSWPTFRSGGFLQLEGTLPPPGGGVPASQHLFPASCSQPGCPPPQSSDEIQFGPAGLSQNVHLGSAKKF